MDGASALIGRWCLQLVALLVIAVCSQVFWHSATQPIATFRQSQEAPTKNSQATASGQLSLPCKQSLPALQLQKQNLGDQSTKGSQLEAYLRMAAAAEMVYANAGLSVRTHKFNEIGSFAEYGRKAPNLPPVGVCSLPANLRSAMGTQVDRTWRGDNSSNGVKTMREALAYARAASPGAVQASDACGRMAAATAAWKLRSGYLGGDPGVLPVVTFVREQQRWMSAYYGNGPGTVRLAPSPPQPISCYMYPKPSENLCRGGLEQYGSMVQGLEDLYPGGRNIWLHEFGQLIDFAAYLPLPAVRGFDPQRNFGRKVLLIVGANGFYRATKYLIDMYSPFFKFDTVYMVEPDAQGMQVPPEYKAINITWKPGYVRVGTRDSTDLLSFIKTSFAQEDYVVVMFDVDATTWGPTMEWGWLADLVSQNWRIVDELFIELHFWKPEIGWKHDRHSSREAFEILHQLRHMCGAAVHAWP